MNEYFFEVLDFFEENMYIFSNDFSNNFFGSLFLGHTGAGIEYYFISENIWYVLVFLILGVCIDMLFYFLGKILKIILNTEKILFLSKSRENYFLFYFRFFPFLGYFGNTLVGMYSKIDIKTLVMKNILGNIIRFMIIFINYLIVLLIFNIYMKPYLGQIDEKYFITFPIILFVIISFLFFLLITLFYVRKEKISKKV